MGRGGGGGGRGTTGLPINNEAGLNRFLKSNPDDPLALALTDFDNNLVMLDFDTGLYSVDKEGVRAAAKAFTKESQDISYSKSYLVGLVQEDALGRGQILSTSEATRYYNRQYQTKSRAILAASKAGDVRLSEAQRARLVTASHGGYLSSVYRTSSSENGSLANASLHTRKGGGGIYASASARNEARRNFLEITGRLR